MNNCEHFYDELSDIYTHIHKDWNNSIKWQSDILDEIIKEHFQDKIHTILDATCRVRTQLIGLAEKGYKLSGSDISKKELRRAKREMKKRDLTAGLFKCDIRDLSDRIKNDFDLIISCDNAIPHLLNDEEIYRAFRSIFNRTKHGILISVRDYDNINKTQTYMIPYGYRMIKGSKTFLFQRWEFDQDIYTVSFFFLKDRTYKAHSIVRGNVFKTKYYAVPTGKLMTLLEKAGFINIKCIKDKYYQPVLTGEK